MLYTVKKRGNAWEVYDASGTHAYTIRKHAKKGYNKYMILKDGTEYLPPAFSWFNTIKAALAWLGCK